jgi:hypothetical protein|tara:strand:- start:132 stop:350 length:219 start_codon:yes stop_codon:yes gene_type:complete
MNVELRIFRARRNRKLADSDWTQAPDSPLSETKKAEWATYRQALRDLTKTATPKFLPNSPKLDESDFPEEPK